MLAQYVWIGLGGALGAIARAALSTLLPVAISGVPLPILLVNILGCFIIGILSQPLGANFSISLNLRFFLITGFLGGFTTFSSFALEFGSLYQKNLYLPAILYATCSILCSLLAFFMGAKLVRLLI